MSARIEIPAGEAAGQNEPRWVRLRNLIDTYPKDSGILKELIQNADDGQARVVRIILDERRNLDHPAASHDRLRHLIGPALLAFNDQPFRDQDFINLQNLANSAKIEDAFKTGRFGLGFNSVYNVTDFPVLLTGEKLWCLDPCETLLQNPAGGERWDLKQIVGGTFEPITSLFEPVGHQVGTKTFNGTAIRLPLRTPEHIHFNQDPTQQNGRARISSTPFVPDEFLDLVKGLSEIAHEILLFLKNVEEISCERIAENGNSEVLLKIEIINASQVREARDQLNQVLKEGLEKSLEAVSAASSGALEVAFEASVVVTHANGSTEQSDWLISTGLFAGKEGSLVKLSQALRDFGERGLPHAGVAVCLGRSHERFPKVAGRMFCYLPIASNEYTGKLPVHIHGAFSLENSRTSLTSHRADEHGKQKLLAEWNDLLLKEGVARAYAAALSQLTKMQSIELPLADRAKAIYSLFPPTLDRLSTHLRTLVEQAARELAHAPIFLDVHGTWQPSMALLQFDEDADLEACLASEGFVFASPRVPKPVEKLLKDVGCPLAALTADHIKDHFETEGGLDCEVADHPFEGLKTRKAIIAVAKFLATQKEDDWTDLPLGLADNGSVHLLSSHRPLLIGTPRQRRILAAAPHRLAAQELNELLGVNDEQIPEGFSLAVPTVWLPIFAERFKPEEGQVIKLNEGKESRKGLPNDDWLKDVLEELNAQPEEDEPENPLIDAVPLIPDDSGVLRHPGTACTPLLLQLNEKANSAFLDALGISYRVLSPQNPLTKPLTEFRDKYERVWSLHPGDLIDSIHASLEELNQEPRKWCSVPLLDWTGDKTMILSYSQERTHPVQKPCRGAAEVSTSEARRDRSGAAAGLLHGRRPLPFLQRPEPTSSRHE